MADILEINLHEPWTVCHVCEQPTPCGWGLPISAETAELIGNDYEGEWGGVPACQDCYEAHAQGLLTADNQHVWRRRQELMRRAYDAAFARE